MKHQPLIFALLALSASGWGCSTRTLELAESLDSSQVGEDAGRDGAVDPDAEEVTRAVCRDSKTCQCSNNLDDDGDKLTDGEDPDCSYAFDDYEGSFATGPHDEKGLKSCQDCFFDSSDSFNDDGCRRPATCDGDTDTDMRCGGVCEPSTTCVDSCKYKTPNGCDCFGCCEVHLPSDKVVYVRLEDKCSYAGLLDGSARCNYCTQSAKCVNPCEECELCMGKTADRLPARCKTGSEFGFVCNDHDECKSSLNCSPLEVCIQGCCLPALY